MHDGFPTPAPLSQVSREVLQALRQWVKTHFGIVFTEDQHDLFRTRIEGFCRELGVGAEVVLARTISGDRALMLRLAEAVSTNHTFFFREGEIFTHFSQEVLNGFTDGPLRIWSAACSSGDEAYTLAMLCRERFGEDARARVKILGTDISERQLRAAEQGFFPLHQLGQLPGDRLGRWFRPAGLGQYQVAEELRKMCTFRRLNLTQPPWPFEQKFHVIFLRNVLYYFEPPTRRRIIEACHEIAEPGAWLITSLTEPMLDLVTSWAPVRPAVYRKVLA